MNRLSKYGNIELTGDYFFDKEDLLNLYRLQKQLLLEENIIAGLVECSNIWQQHSNDLQASWLCFPKEDYEILKYIKSNVHFTSFDDYSK